MDTGDRGCAWHKGQLHQGVGQEPRWDPADRLRPRHSGPVRCHATVHTNRRSSLRRSSLHPNVMHCATLAFSPFHYSDDVLAMEPPSSLTRYVTNVAATSIGTGAMGMMGNKGGCVDPFDLTSTMHPATLLRRKFYTRDGARTHTRAAHVPCASSASHGAAQGIT